MADEPRRTPRAMLAFIIAVAAIVAVWWAGYLIYTFQNGPQPVKVKIGVGGIEFQLGGGKPEQPKE